MTHTAAPPLLELCGLSKRFGDRPVLQRASLELRQGEVHALLGENGAGKSTLMNILTGVYQADEGHILLRGERLPVRRPADAIAAGIGMVHQHFRLVERFSVAENLLLAAGGRRELRTVPQAVAALRQAAGQTGLGIDPARRVADLSVAERQRVEICKILALGARILVLDEPTAVLTDREAADMLAAMNRMAEGGCSIILITHKLREVVGHSQRLTIMRQGRTVASNLATDALSQAAIAALMVGEHPDGPQRQPSSRIANGPDLLNTQALCVRRPDGGVGIVDLSLRVRAGEIVGVAGVGGNGQQQLADALLGTARVEAGSIELDGARVNDASVARRRDLGLRIIPSDRAASGLIGELPVADNLALTRVRTGRYRRWWLDRWRMRADAQASIAQHDIAGARPDTRTSLLSGGNAQKVLLARELDADMRLLIAHSPTRGLDVKACASVHAAIRAAAARGAACLLISEDLEEVLALSDRIVVISAGRITGECPGGASAERVGHLMLGTAGAALGEAAAHHA
ncbi:ATP-binding cassette domain-containing protein [Corticibacter populi]|uniref:ATP-binding cassette domain-containing protein n=1 Tax=Corticibacter populi TaxID=1550736 RepID=A0A3M6QPF3_9BURK|nr:ATP-binding cassette domain-containing protein [Corticibacter populi]RMX04928.1 ATP-binding cassette domain-containing protein [Corticibacter populi]RZS33647.1 nucleoside ABC transporter ATP-binding protein [Corticibacter populi]